MQTVITQSGFTEVISSVETEARETAATHHKKIWIDLDNSPHVPFFKPIVEELQAQGYPVLLTARDCFQVCELAELLQIRYEAIGRHYGKSRIMKLLGLGIRTLQLAPVVRSMRP